MNIEKELNLPQSHTVEVNSENANKLYIKIIKAHNKLQRDTRVKPHFIVIRGAKIKELLEKYIDDVTSLRYQLACDRQSWWRKMFGCRPARIKPTFQEIFLNTPVVFQHEPCMRKPAVEVVKLGDSLQMIIKPGGTPQYSEMELKIIDGVSEDIKIPVEFNEQEQG
jgi:hypothetical protein